MKKRICSAILALLLVFSFTVCAFAESNINAARKGVAKVIEVLYLDGEVYGAYGGSGFFVGNDGEDVQYLVTNYHVVQEHVENYKGEKFEVTDGYGAKHIAQLVIYVFFDSEDSTEAYLVDYDATQDIAVLKLEKKTDKRQPLKIEIPTDDMVGDAMYVVGYPGNVEDSVDATSAWGVEDSVVSKGTIGRLVTESGSGNKWIQSTDTVSSFGNSGGPLLNENGNVIGVACMITSDTNVEEYVNFGVNIEKVVTMLRKNAIDFMSADDKAEEKSEPSLEVTVTPSEATEAPSVEVVAAAESKESSGSNVWIIAVAAVALAVIAAVVIVLLKKSKKKTAPVQVDDILGTIPKTMPANSAVKGVTPVVRSLSSQHNGKKVSVKSGSITIGRSRDCTIVFKEDTPGVSGKHCAVTWDSQNKVFILKDMGSTYGTFLESGMRLDANRTYRIKAGDSFYLGEKANTLKVEVE